MAIMHATIPKPSRNLLEYRRRPVPTVAPGASMDAWERQFLLSHVPFVPHRELVLGWAFERREAKQMVVTAAEAIARASSDAAGQPDSAFAMPLLTVVAPPGSGKTTLLLLIWQAWAADVAAALRAGRPDLDEPLFLFAGFGDHSGYHFIEERLSAAELLAKRLWASYRGVRGVWEDTFVDFPRPAELQDLAAFSLWVRQQEAAKRGHGDPSLIPLVLLVDDLSRPPEEEGGAGPDLAPALAELLLADAHRRMCTVAVATSLTLHRLHAATAVPGVALCAVPVPQLGPIPQDYCLQQLQAKFVPNAVPGALMRGHRRMAFEVACSGGHFGSLWKLLGHDFNQRYDNIGPVPDPASRQALVEVALWQLGGRGAGCPERRLFGDVPLVTLAVSGWVLYRRADAAVQLVWPEVVPNALRWIALSRYRPKSPTIPDWAEDQLWTVFKVLGEGEPRPAPTAWQMPLRPTAANEEAPPLDALELWQALPALELLRAYALLRHDPEPPRLEDVLPGALVKPWPGDTAIQVQAAVAQHGVRTPGAQHAFSVPAPPLLCQTAHRHSTERQMKVVLSMYDVVGEDGSRRPVLMLQQMRLRAIATPERLVEWARGVHSRATDAARYDCLHLAPGSFYAVVFYIGDPPPPAAWAALPPGTVLLPTATVQTLLGPVGGWPVLQSLRSVVARKARVRRLSPAPPPAAPEDAYEDVRRPHRRGWWPERMRPLNKVQRRWYWKTGRHPRWWKPQLGDTEWDR
eukprot:EG_transcript_2709